MKRVVKVKFHLSFCTKSCAAFFFQTLSLCPVQPWLVVVMACLWVFPLRWRVAAQTWPLSTQAWSLCLSCQPELESWQSIYEGLSVSCRRLTACLFSWQSWADKYWIRKNLKVRNWTLQKWAVWTVEGSRFIASRGGTVVVLVALEPTSLSWTSGT